MIRGARQLLTLRGPRGPRCGSDLRELSIIPDGALLIRDGVIVEVGPTRRIENLAAARGAVEINAAGRVVMPGFVDSHTHMVFPAPGNSTGDLESAVRAVRLGTGQRLQNRTQAYLDSMARHGTTTVEAKTGCGADESAEIKLFRVLAALKDSPLHVVPTFLFRLPDPDLTGKQGLEEASHYMLSGLLPKIHRRRFARFADVAWDADPAYHHHYRRYVELCRKLGLPCKIHADQGDAGPAIAMALRHLAVSIDHLETATAEDAARLATGGVLATLLPCAALRHGCRHAPARALIDAGVPVVLASNFNPQHSPTLSMQTVVALACMHLEMTAEEAISAATINGACAVGRADRVGSLEVGKSADLTILNLACYRDFTSHLGTNLVHMTMKRGDFIYKEGDVARRAPEEFSLNHAWD